MVGSRKSAICWIDQFSNKKKKRRSLDQKHKGEIFILEQDMCGTRGFVPRKMYCCRDVRLWL